MPTVASTIEVIRACTQAGQWREALAVLNGFGAYRYSAVYAFDGDMLHNRLLFDRERPNEAGIGGSAPVASTYCGYVRSGNCPFELLDSLVDERVRGHAKKVIVRSYMGVPIMSSRGECIGTLCCFDHFAVVSPLTLRTLIEQAAPLFQSAIEP